MLTVGVGERIPQKWYNNLVNMGEGAMLNYDPQSKNLFICMVLDGITAKERQKTKNGLVRFRYIEKNSCFLPVVCFDNPRDGFSLELPFNPKAYGLPELKIESNAMYIYLIEKKDYTFKAIRMLGLGSNFIHTMEQNFNAAIQDDDFDLKYKSFLNNYVYQLQPIEIWEEATLIDWDK